MLSRKNFLAIDKSVGCDHVLGSNQKKSLSRPEIISGLPRAGVFCGSQDHLTDEDGLLLSGHCEEGQVVFCF